MRSFIPMIVLVCLIACSSSVRAADNNTDTGNSTQRVPISMSYAGLPLIVNGAVVDDGFTAAQLLKRFVVSSTGTLPISFHIDSNSPYIACSSSFATSILTSTPVSFDVTCICDRDQGSTNLNGIVEARFEFGKSGFAPVPFSWNQVCGDPYLILADTGLTIFINGGVNIVQIGVVDPQFAEPQIIEGLSDEDNVTISWTVDEHFQLGTFELTSSNEGSVDPKTSLSGVQDSNHPPFIGRTTPFTIDQTCKKGASAVISFEASVAGWRDPVRGSWIRHCSSAALMIPSLALFLIVAILSIAF